MLPGFLAQVQSDYEAICAGDFSEVATVSDGDTTVSLTGLFDANVQQFDPESQSHVLYEGSKLTVAETSTDFNLRRDGLLVTIRGVQYKVRASDWEYDGLGSLTLYLDKVNPTQ